MHSPECIAKVILEHNCKVIVEVGVASCSFCDQLIGLLGKAGHELEEYWLVDPWQHGYKCGSCGPNITNEKWDALHAAAVKRIVKNPFLKVARLTSVEAAKLFPLGYFDLVYIDADHTYLSVMEDCDAWMPKLKERGIMSGHDFSGGWQPVVDAVNDYFLRRAGNPPLKWFYEIDDKHYRMDAGVWVVEL